MTRKWNTIYITLCSEPHSWKMSALLGHNLFLLQRENPLLNPASLPLARHSWVQTLLTQYPSSHSLCHYLLYYNLYVPNLCMN